ncbi:MAG: ribosome small subunit-dependent GTPase A [Elusimicrobia bacterium]|nr:ribosome small subunit-dependent GTPase A [Elusimicrobiota bacterium]
MKKVKLEDIGYSDFFKSKRESVKDNNITPARITAEHKELYILRNEASEFSAKVTGKMMFTASSREDYPAVGDWVLITIVDKDRAVINKILPRRTVLKRKSAGGTDIQVIAANIDVAFIIQSPDRDYSLNRFERYSALAESGRIKPAVVLNKTDLIDEEDLEFKVSEIKDRFRNSSIYTTSTVTGKGINDLKNDIKKGVTYCFLGSSGVGKSSIINTLAGKELIKTGEISSHTNRGRHITTYRQLVILENGGLLIDNPGMREIGLLDSDTGIKNVFSEIRELSENCRFSDCTHNHEPGCAVLKAVKSGELDKGKYRNYIKLVKENEFNTMSNFEKRQKDRKFGKFIKQTKKQLEKYK